MKVNEIYTLEAIDNGMQLEGICKLDEKIVFVPGLIKGEIADVKLLKVNTNYALGKIVSLQKISDKRCERLCKVSSKCGGCDGMHIDYMHLLDIKMQNGINTITKQKVKFNYTPSIYGMGMPYYYRNKAIFPLRNVGGKIVIGMFEKASHSLVKIDNCLLQDESINMLAKNIVDILNNYDLKAYDEISKIGDIRNIVIRKSKYTDEVMAIFVLTSDKLIKNGKIKIITDELVLNMKNSLDITSVMVNINTEDTNVVLSNNNICVRGREYITDKIGEYIFKITVNSFFQVNTQQAEVLYNLVKEKLNLNGSETLLDLYCGVGSIGIFLSKSVKKVYGAEIVKEAIDMAKENIKINEIANVECVNEDASIFLKEVEARCEKIDVVVVDPPRKGLDLDGIDILKKISPKKIAYVSCNTATLARDLKLLEDNYDIESIDFVDMFPFTHHVESVVLLTKVQ